MQCAPLEQSIEDWVYRVLSLMRNPIGIKFNTFAWILDLDCILIKRLSEVH